MKRAAERIDAIAVGHVTVDAYPDRERPGGSVWYATQVWRAMGLSTRMVTAFGPDFEFPFKVPAAAAVGDATTRFTNRYAKEDIGDTVRHLGAQADPVEVPTGLARPRLLFLCPVMGEVELADWMDVPAGFRAAGLQGWLRRSARGRVISGPSRVDPELFAGLDAACLSEEDLAGDSAWLEKLRAVVPVVALTRGDRGCVVYTGSRASEVPAHPAQSIDPTGAGDTFGAVFAWHVAEGRSPVVAADLASIRAARAVEWIGAAPMHGLQSPTEVTTLSA